MKKINVTVQGLTALLQNRFLQSSIEGKSVKKTGGLKDLDPKDKLYRLPNGKIYQPANHFEMCLVNAAKNFQIRGKKRSTYSKLFGCALQVMPEAIVHKIQKYDLFETTAVNPNTKGRTLVVRPRFPKWELDFTIEILEEGIPVEVVKEVIDYAGRFVGVGDWRPDKKGKFGKFIVTKFQEVGKKK